MSLAGILSVKMSSAHFSIKRLTVEGLSFEGVGLQLRGLAMASLEHLLLQHGLQKDWPCHMMRNLIFFHDCDCDFQSFCIACSIRILTPWPRVMMAC